MRFSPLSRSCSVLLALTFGCTSALASNIEEIVVTAEFSSKSLQDTAASVSVISGEELARQQAVHLEETLASVPNVNFASGASRARFIQLRGIGERGQFREPLNSSVGLIIDGVDFSGFGTSALLFDVDQVEVLRGPQGTLYGSNALAGLINIRSKPPSEQFEGYVDVGVSNHGGRDVGAVVSGGGLRLSAFHTESDGYMDNTFINSSTNDRKETLLRLRGDFSLGEVSDLSMTLGYADIDNGYDAFSLDNDRDTRSDEPGFDQSLSTYAAATLSTEVAGNELSVSLAHANSDIDYGYDEDWTFVGFDPFEYSSTDRYVRDRSMTTLDIRLSGGEARPWTIGLYNFQQDVDLRRVYTFAAADFDSVYQVDRVAAYGEIELPLREGLRARLGARLERAKASYRDSEGAQFEPDDNVAGFRAQLEADVGANGLVYLSASSGYKAAGFNTDGTLAREFREYDEETLWNLEAGLRSTLWDERLRVAASVFWMQRDDVQINRSLIVERPDGSSEFIDFVDNAAEGFNRGIELDLNVRLTETLSGFASVGLLDTEVTRFDSDGDDFLDGRDQAHAPSYTYHIGADWLSGPWSARVALQGRDGFFFSNSHNAETDSANLVNMKFGYAAERFSVSIWGRNLTDEDTEVRGFRFGNDPRLIYDTRTYTQLGEPRRYGVSVTLQLP
ncbi:MAG: TonB-dependent receptor [Pseudomonadaceae bacterium]|nr:TonB-dependent receptor [Pseudomonadaceae bacterium]